MNVYLMSGVECVMFLVDWLNEVSNIDKMLYK